MRLPGALEKRFARTAELLRNSPIVVLGGAVAALVVCLVTAGLGQDQTRTVFMDSAPIDFKGASILGNPGAVILAGQENQFSKKTKAVLETEDQIKAEISSLKAQIAAMKGEPAVSPSPVPYGPQPAPSPGPVASPNPMPTGFPALGQSPIDASRTHVASDSLHESRAAPAFGLELSGRRTPRGVSMISFPVKTTGNVAFKKPGIILPSGSYVRASLMTGVEAPEGKTYPVLLQLDYAYVIPNDKRLDLSGCFMIAKAQGDLSTERVQMQATKLSCVSKRGGMFEREVNGFIADDADNSFAVVGSVNSKQDRVAATAFLSSIVAGVGKAIQQAQTTSQATPLGGSQSVVTGDQMKYIGAGGAADAATMVTQWYLKQAQNLLPTINVGSGQVVWVVMQDQVDLPKDYFTQNGASGGDDHASMYSYFTRVMD